MSKLKFRDAIKRRAEYFTQQNNKKGIALWRFYRWISDNNFSGNKINNFWLNYTYDDISEWIELMDTYQVPIDEQHEAYDRMTDPTYRNLGNLNQIDSKGDGNTLPEIYTRYIIHERSGYATKLWLIDNFPGMYIFHNSGFTFPGQNYVGPGNPLYQEIRNQLDGIAAEHDMLYSKATTEQDIHDADELFLKRINHTSLHGMEWFKGAIAAYAINMKLFFEKRTGVWYGLNKNADFRLTDGKPKWDYKNMQQVPYHSRHHLLELIKRKEQLDKIKPNQTASDYDVDEYIDKLVDAIPENRYA